MWLAVALRVVPNEASFACLAFVAGDIAAVQFRQVFHVAEQEKEPFFFLVGLNEAMASRTRASTRRSHLKKRSEVNTQGVQARQLCERDDIVPVVDLHVIDTERVQVRQTRANVVVGSEALQRILTGNERLQARKELAETTDRLPIG